MEFGHQNAHQHPTFAPASHKTNERNNQLFDFNDDGEELLSSTAGGDEHELRSALGLSLPQSFDEGPSMLSGSGVVPRAAEVFAIVINLFGSFDLL